MQKFCSNNPRLNSILLLLLTALLWSTGGVLIKLINLDPIAIAGFRSLFAAMVFLPFVGNPFKVKLDKFKVLCALCYAGNVISIVVATKYTTSANAILLQYTAPIYVTIFSAGFLGERVSKREYLTVAGVLVGMLLFAFDGLANKSMFGNVLAMLSGMFFAGIILFSKKTQSSSAFEPLFLGNILTALLCSPFFFTKTIAPTDFKMLLILGVFQLGIPYLLYAFAIRHISAIQTSLITTLEPILNPIWVFLVTSELPSFLSLIGGTIVITSIASNYILLAIKHQKTSMGANIP